MVFSNVPSQVFQGNGVQPGRNVKSVQMRQPDSFFQPVPRNQTLILGTSGVRSSKVNFVQPQPEMMQGIIRSEQFIQSQVQTVRPAQAVYFKQKQDPQTLIQQIVPTPQGPMQIIPQLQGSQIPQQANKVLAFRSPVQQTIFYQGETQFVNLPRNQDQNSSQKQNGINLIPQTSENDQH